MSDIRKSIDNLPFILKVILIIFFGPIYGAIYRLLGGQVKDIVIGIVWFFTSGIFGIGWIIDVVTVILKGKPTILA